MYFINSYSKTPEKETFDLYTLNAPKHVLSKTILIDAYSTRLVYM